MIEREIRMEVPYTRIYAEIDLDAIVGNVTSVAARLKETSRLIGVVKSDGYGHGSVPVAKAIEAHVWGFAVAALEEGELLRAHGIKKPILVLGTVRRSQLWRLLDSELRPTIFRLLDGKELSELAVKAGKRVPVHLALDTGMSRLGFDDTRESLDEAEAISRLPGIQIEGLFTHFPSADEADKSLTRKQFAAYRAFAEHLEERGVALPMKHCSNSAAVIDLADMNLDAVRTGIILYGICPSGEVDRESVPVKPALSLYSFITCIRKIEAGTAVSYGGTFVAPEQMRIATVSAGYGDGYPRALSNRGEVLICGRRAPILGRICMDQLMVDVTHIPDACEEDRVTLIGRDGDQQVSVEDLASACGGFRYEIPCQIGKRVPRVYIENSALRGKKDYFKDRYEEFL